LSGTEILSRPAAAPLRSLLLVALLVALTGCERSREHQGEGQVVAVDAASSRVSIRHDGVAGLMGPTTLQVVAEPAALLRDVVVGERIRFRLVRRASQLRLVEISKVPSARPGFHDHTPHHGGVVAMVGMIHLEALATAEGRVRVYLSDLWRRPLPLTDVSGSVTFRLSGVKQEVPVTIRPDYVEASGPALTQPELNVGVHLQRNDGPVEMTFQLPLRQDAASAAGLLSEGCAAVAARPQASPRCAIRFAAAITAMTADDQHLLVAAAGLGITSWSLPDMQLRRTFAASPAAAGAGDETPHAEAATVLAISPDGRLALVAIEARVLIYSMTDGQLLRELPWRDGVVRSAAWEPGGERALISGFYRPAAHLLGVVDGRIERTFSVDPEVSSVAFSVDGSLVAVGGESGVLRIFRRDDGRTIHTWRDATRALRSPVFLDGDQVAAVSEDGVSSVWSMQRNQRIVSLPGPALPFLAVNRSTRVAVVGGHDGTLHAVTLAAPRGLAQVPWHEHPLAAVEWSPHVLASADVGGVLAIWDATVPPFASKPGDEPTLAASP